MPELITQIETVDLLPVTARMRQPFAALFPKPQVDQRLNQVDSQRPPDRINPPRGSLRARLLNRKPFINRRTLLRVFPRGLSYLGTSYPNLASD